MKDTKDIQNTCFKLNSQQLQTLLAGYLYATNEPHIPPVSTFHVFFHKPHASVVVLVFFKLSSLFAQLLCCSFNIAFQVIFLYREKEPIETNVLLLTSTLVTA